MSIFGFLISKNSKTKWVNKTGIKITPMCANLSQKNTASRSNVVENLKAPNPQIAADRLKALQILCKKFLPLIKEKTPNERKVIKTSNPDNANGFIFWLYFYFANGNMISNILPLFKAEVTFIFPL